jgi:hypothetical protein
MKPLEFVALGVRSEWNQEWPSSTAGQHPMLPTQMLSRISVFGSNRSIDGCAAVVERSNPRSKRPTKWLMILTPCREPMMPRRVLQIDFYFP